ncbi:unnamed protein product [Rhizophagus irregularis]|nr:unnamed protein product [Rhizophagus irregularis]
MVMFSGGTFWTVMTCLWKTLDSSVFPDFALCFLDGFIRIFRHSSALWRLISMTCSLVSRDIFEHGFHGWFLTF